MFKFISQFFMLFIFLTCLAKAEEFNNILINGNERVSEETILVFSDLSNKNFLDENSINDVLMKLYDSGFFKNISIVIKNKNLIIDVEENPIIQTVFIEGIKKKKLEESLYDVLTLKNRSSFNSFAAKKDVDKILNLLKTKGYYFSKVVSSSQDLGLNKIDLIYKIELGKKARITKISFIGDKKFKDNTLRNVILSEEFQFWKIVSGKKFLNESLIELDKKLLNNFYKNKGFYDAFIETSFANYLSGEEFELIYSISSGKKYYFDNLSITLPIGYKEKDFNKLIKIFNELKGEPYSLNSINKILNEIDKIVAKEQYEFLKSNVDEKINDNLINLTFNIAESEKFYVEKINIFGNNITREDVIRNLFVVDEGDAFNQLLHKKTLNNLRSLNFFKTVNEDIINGTLENQKVINITVEEKATGEISAGAGVGTGGGTLAFGVQENNFLGRGLKFGTDITLSQESVKGEISLNNPNYNGTNRSLDFSAQSQTTDRLQNNSMYQYLKINPHKTQIHYLQKNQFYSTCNQNFVDDLLFDSELRNLMIYLFPYN